MPESKGRRDKKRQVGRPTPPRTPSASVRKRPPSPTWYVAAMFGLMGLGVLLVLARYVFQAPNWTLLAGLGGIAAGFLMTTNYR